MTFYTNIITWGNTLLCRKVEDGKRKKERIQDFHPRLWIPSSSKEDTGWKTLNGHPVKEFDAGDIKDTRQFLDQCKEVSNFSVYGNIQAHYQYISQNWHDEVHYDISKIIVAYLDIETGLNEEGGFATASEANGEIVTISLKFSNFDKTIVLGLKEFVSGTDENLLFIHCKSELHLLEKFLEIWSANYPDIISGWYVKGFDIPFLINRISRVLGEDQSKKISPWKNIRFREETIMGRKQEFYDVSGISTLDYLDLYKKFTYKVRESYTLDYISEEELGTKKIDYSEYGSLHKLYDLNYKKFIEYNKRDTDLVILLENKLKLIELAITMAYNAHVNFEDVLSQGRMWDSIIYNYLLDKGIVIPEKPPVVNTSIEGAYVKEPKPGFYHWVVSFDLTSLYPHLIMQYAISPENMLNDDRVCVSIDDLVNKKFDTTFLKERGITMTANGQLFRKVNRGFLGDLMFIFFNKRKEYKKKMIQLQKEQEEQKHKLTPEESLRYKNDISKYSNFEKSQKILINACYGSMANNYFRYKSNNIAEGITMSGQLSIRWIARKINEYLNELLRTDGVDYIIAVDTDSNYINMDEFVKQYHHGKPNNEIQDELSRFCSEELTNFINESYQELAEYMNVYENKMVMKLEAISDRGIWTGKKRYILNVLENEGVKYSEPKIKMMGIEAIKSSTPGICRDKLKEAIKIILTKTNEDLIKFKDDFMLDFKKLEPELISFPRSVNGIHQYQSNSSIYKKGCPIHVRASLLHNFYLDQKGVNTNYKKIQNGDKIKYVYLKTPNPIRENIIAFIGELPDEFGLHQYVDYDLQFEKSFLLPLTSILDAIGWKSKEISTIDAFFA